MRESYPCFVDLWIDEEIEQEPALPSTWYEIFWHEELGKGSAPRRVRSDKGYTVNSVGQYKKKPGHKKAMNSFFAKLSLWASVERMEGRDSREEEEHWHLPDVHEADPTGRKVIQDVVARKRLRRDIPATTNRAICYSGVKQEDPPGEGDTNDVNPRKASCRSSSNWSSGCTTISCLWVISPSYILPDGWHSWIVLSLSSMLHKLNQDVQCMLSSLQFADLKFHVM